MMRHLMLSIILTILSTFFLFISCEKIRPVTDIPVQDLGFENLQVGDQFFYGVSNGPNIYNRFTEGCSIPFSSKNQVIELEVVQKIDRQFKVKGYLHSVTDPSSVDEVDAQSMKTHFVDYKWQFTADSLVISTESGGGYFFYAKRRFSLARERGIHVGSEYCDSLSMLHGQFYGTDIIINDQFYDTLNVLRFDSGMSFDAPLWTFVYSKENGFVRIVLDGELFSIFYDRVN